MEDTRCEAEASPKIERALRAAVRRYIRDLREAEGRARETGELRALFAPFGFAEACSHDFGTPGSLARLSSETRRSMVAALTGELQRLGRLARAGKPSYDVNRHIAARRALAALAGSAPDPHPADRETLLPGHVLNARFRARKSRGRRPAELLAGWFAPAPKLA